MGGTLGREDFDEAGGWGAGAMGLMMDAVMGRAGAWREGWLGGALGVRALGRLEGQAGVMVGCPGGTMWVGARMVLGWRSCRRGARGVRPVLAVGVVSESRCWTWCRALDWVGVALVRLLMLVRLLAKALGRLLLREMVRLLVGMIGLLKRGLVRQLACSWVSLLVRLRALARV